VAARELAATGAYEVRVTVNDKLWGLYCYDADGKLPRPKRQQRGVDDPTTYLEAPRIAFTSSGATNESGGIVGLDVDADFARGAEG